MVICVVNDEQNAKRRFAKKEMSDFTNGLTSSESVCM